MMFLKTSFKNLATALILISFSCDGPTSLPPLSEAEIQQKLVAANKIMVAHESAAIDSFIAKHRYNMMRKGSGLRIEKVMNGTGRKVTLEDTLNLEHKIFLLSGSLCYQSNADSLLTMVMHPGSQIKGIEEALMDMSEGDKVRLVIPSYLAFGMLGDQNKIPPASPLFVELNLIEIK
jgi:FKBP-type peptidyl-prolyl cis-trans isomerase FkpA